MEKLEIWEGWVKVNGEKIDDLEKYIFDQFSERTVSKINSAHDIELIIGTDSMVKSDNKRYKGKEVSFMTVIVFKKGNNGCHVIKRRENEKASGFVPTAIKLNGEINRTAALAFWIRETIYLDPTIHLDLNPKETAGSFEVYKYIRGYFEACNFECYYKPDGFAASAAADYYL
ncbi:MAG: ribonuclease H-like YkuK family protein [Bacteroidia bacterium]